MLGEKVSGKKVTEKKKQFLLGKKESRKKYQYSIYLGKKVTVVILGNKGTTNRHELKTADLKIVTMVQKEIH